MSADSRASITVAQTENLGVYVSPMTAWEVATLVAKNRLQLALSPEAWFDALLGLAGVRLAAADDLRFLRGQGIVRVNHPLGLQEHTVALLRECHKVALTHPELLENLARYEDLTPAGLSDRCVPLLVWLFCLAHLHSSLIETVKFSSPSMGPR